MKKAMKLKGRVFLEKDRTLRFESTVYDGQTFSLKVSQFDVQLGGSFKPSKMYVDAHLFCVCEAQQGDVCYLTLPKPTINYGRQVTVKEHLLQPRDVSIEDFKPEKKGGVVSKKVKHDKEWTEEEMANAVPVPMPNVDADELP